MEKTKTQVFNNPDLASKSSLFKIDGEDVENVSDFTYLGQVICNKDEKGFTEHRISRAKAKFNKLKEVLTDLKVRLKTRRKILQSCVRSRLLYGIAADIPHEP